MAPEAGQHLLIWWGLTDLGKSLPFLSLSTLWRTLRSREVYIEAWQPASRKQGKWGARPPGISLELLQVQGALPHSNSCHHFAGYTGCEGTGQAQESF